MPIYVTSTLLPKSGGVWPVLDSQYLRGGYRTVLNATARTAIDSSKLVAGMLVQQTDTNELWQLGDDLVTWSLFTATPKSHTHIPSEVGVSGSSLITELERSTWNSKQDSLGFVPYNSTNPSGFTSNLGTVTSVAANAPLSSTGGTTPTISIAAATTSVAGSMSAADKSKLDGVAANANLYVHPSGDGNLHVPATGTTNNGRVLTAGATAGALSWTAPVTGVTATSPVVSTGGTAPVISMAAATSSANGYMTSVYASKLEGIAASANLYVHPTGDGNLHVPANGTTNNGKVLTSGATAGTYTWASPSTGTVTSVAGSGAVNGLTLTGTVTSTGSLTLGGSISSVSTSGNFQMNSLGVGTAAAGTAGDIRATGDVTAFYSDKRLKDVICAIPDALEKVMMLNGVIYKANKLAHSFGYTKNELLAGVLAQDVQAVLPEVVCPAPFDIGRNEDGTEFSLSGENYLTVKYDRLIPLLIEAIKEQQRKIDILSARISSLE